MDARPKTVRDILHTGDQYIIPLFQRYYSWKKDNWDRLRKDIWALMENGAKEVHFLGPLVCTRTSHFPGSIPAYQLIDGQQRLTTLTVLLAALRDVAITRNLPDLAAEVTEDLLVHKRKQDVERYKLLPRLGDREALIAIVEGKDASPFSDSGIFQALKYFRRYAEHWARQDTESQLRKLLDTVTGRLSLVVVTIDSENPYEIFESLNSTGLPLEESDLIRNFIFMQVPLSEQQDFHNKHWKRLEDMFEGGGTDEAIPMTPFYRDYLTRNGQYSKERATFSDFKKHYREAGLTPEKQVEELIHFAELDLMIRRPLSDKRENLRRLLCQIDGMEISTAYPLILNLLDRNHRGQLASDALDGCLKDLVSFVLRRSICNETTRQYNKWFLEAITVIKNDPRKDLEQYWLRRRWPDDKTLQDRVVDFPLYRRESRKARVMLEAIEVSYGHKEKVELKDLSIEHVMPQSIGNTAAGKSWKAMLGSDWEHVHDKYLHTLGNLTLTGYNPDLSNSGFEKKKVLLEESHLELNGHFNPLSSWTAEAIENRTRMLAGVVAKLWPRPSGSTYEASPEAMPEPEGLSQRKKQQLEYWRALDMRLEERGVPQDLFTPEPTDRMTVDLGTSKSIEICVGIIMHQKRVYVSLVSNGDVGKVIEDRLKDQKDQIESAIGYKLQWEERDIHIVDSDVVISDRDDWPVQHDWLGDRLEDFLRVFKSRIETIEAEVLTDPDLRAKVEMRQTLVDFWRGCAAVMEGAGIALRPSDMESGRAWCRFEGFEGDISLGLWYTKYSSVVGVYFRVGKKASRPVRSALASLVTNSIGELKAEVAANVEWEEPYLSVSTEAKSFDDRTTWPPLQIWLKEKACVMNQALRKRIPLDE